MEHRVDAGGGYQLALVDGKLVCWNAKGKQLAAVPKEVRESTAATQLLNARDWLEAHARTCAETVEGWMLRSLPVPLAVLQAIWPDPDWKANLRYLVIQAGGSAGLLAAVDPQRGAGVIDLDGETRWFKQTSFHIPHPVLLDELESWRELATEIGARQGISQLYREVFPRPAHIDPTATEVRDYADAEFEQLNHVLGLCRSMGLRVRGGAAQLRLWDTGPDGARRPTEARYEIGEDDPFYQTQTGALRWVDSRERTLRLSEVGPVAWSEGHRMAAAIHARRVVNKEEQDD